MAKSVTKRTGKNTGFEGIMSGIEDAKKSFGSGKKLTFDKAPLPPKPKEISSDEIFEIREMLNMSQHVFAQYLNVSTKTVQAWEQKVNQPSGPALKLIRLFQEKPSVFLGEAS